MPLRDHFHPPLSETRRWDSLHGAWPALIVIDLNKRLPERFVASPRVHLGAEFEIDVAASEIESGVVGPGPAESPNGGTATAVWAPPRPTMTVATAVPEADEYEVQIHHRDGRLVAAIEIVSPSNKDRPENRRNFAAKCAALIHNAVSVAIVDLVTLRESNLFYDLLDLLGHSMSGSPPIYAAACRWRSETVGTETAWRIETWEHTLEVGKPLPVLPIWLGRDFAIPLDLERTYEETLKGLRIA